MDPNVSDGISLTVYSLDSMYHHTRLIIRNWGLFSQTFILGRGVCQRCPLSCHLFNIISQIIVYYLQACGHFIWWMFLGDLSSMYADGIALILPSLQQIPGVLRDLEVCGQYTGLRLNVDKTVVYSQKATHNYKFHGVLVTSNPVKYLGTFLGVAEAMEKLNFEVAISKMRYMANKWRKRPLSLFAQVLVFKTMIISQITHVLNTVFILSKQLDFLQNFANEFLWQGKNKLLPDLCQNPVELRGLNYVHIKNFVHKLRAKWMTRLWLDACASWSALIWPDLSKIIPLEVVPRMTGCSEKLFNQLMPFYSAVV